MFYTPHEVVENNDLFKPTFLIFKTRQTVIDFRSVQKFCIQVHYCRTIILVALLCQRPDVVVNTHANFSFQSAHKTRQAHCSSWVALIKFGKMWIVGICLRRPARDVELIDVNITNDKTKRGFRALLLVGYQEENLFLYCKTAISALNLEEPTKNEIISTKSYLLRINLANQEGAP